MKSLLNSVGAVGALLVTFMASAHADISDLPEPGSMVLAGLGVGLAAYFLRKRK
jgi:hypothetical protein